LTSAARPIWRGEGTIRFGDAELPVTLRINTAGPDATVAQTTKNAATVVVREDSISIPRYLIARRG
jgi:hypothetical protein